MTTPKFAVAAGTRWCCKTRPVMFVIALRGVLVNPMVGPNRGAAPKRKGQLTYLLDAIHFCCW
jgi:hypothetical protein